MSDFMASATCGGKYSISFETTNVEDFELLKAMCRYLRDRENAISVEWIKSKIDVILDSYPDGNGETEILCKLLYEWEKVNG